jgi:cell division protein FtsA
MARNIEVGLDVGTSGIKIVVTELRKGDYCPRILATGECLSLGIKNGYVVNLEDTISSIKKCVLQTESKIGIKYI